MLPQGVLEVVDRHLGGIARAIDAPPGVDQFTVSIEHVKMRRPERAIGQRHLLRGVVQIQPGELLLFHPLDHVIEAILGVGVWAVGVDAHEPDPLGNELLRRLAGHLVRPKNVRAMVAGEKDHQHILVKIAHPIGVAVRRGQLEIRDLVADL